MEGRVSCLIRSDSVRFYFNKLGFSINTTKVYFPFVAILQWIPLIWVIGGHANVDIVKSALIAHFSCHSRAHVVH